MPSNTKASDIINGVSTKVSYLKTCFYILTIMHLIYIKMD